jgi:hypothetical protein
MAARTSAPILLGVPARRPPRADYLLAFLLGLVVLILVELIAHG